MPATHHRAPRDDEKALLLLAGVLAFCGYLYLLGIALSAIGALLVLAAQPASAVTGVVMGIVGIVACASQSLFCFAASGFIKLAVRGVHAVEETASHLRAMHR